MRTSDLAGPERRPGIGPTASLGRLVLIRQKLGTDMAMTLLDGALSSDLNERSCHGCSSHQLLVILHEFLTRKIKTAHQNSDPPGHMPPNSQEVFRKHQTCAQHRMVIYELSAQRADQEHKSSRQLNPFFFSLLSLPGGQSRRGLLFSPLASPPFPSLFHGLFHVPFHGSFRTASVRHNRTLYWKS